MKTIIVEKSVGGENGIFFTLNCKNCGAWLVYANQNLSLEQRNYFNRCIVCGLQADSREINEAWMQFKKELFKIK